MSAPLVSILIPCCNAAPWLRATLESALAQTWPHREIIVVNDGSRDDSPAIARSFSPRGVVTLDQPNRGQSAAFNRALTAARGDYVCFLDADDLLSSDKIAAQVRLLQSAPRDRVATCRWGRFTGGIDTAGFHPTNLWEADLPAPEWLVRAWSAHEMMHGAAWLIPRDLVQRAGGWDESLSLINDFEFFSRVLLQSSGALFCPRGCTYYRSGLAGSLSGAKSTRAWESAHRSLHLGTGRLLAREDTPRTRAACARVFAAFYYDAFPHVPALRRDALARVRAWGCDLPPAPGGPKFRLISQLIGWRLARRLQQWTSAARRPILPAHA